MKRDNDWKRKPARIVHRQFRNVLKPSELTDEEWKAWEQTNEGLYHYEIGALMNIPAWQVSKIITKVVNVLAAKQKESELAQQLEEDYSEVERRCRSRHIYANNLQSNVCPITGKLVKVIMSNFF
jgi:uncharacterized protein YnzC (UPF0291/DUF896 family)